VGRRAARSAEYRAERQRLAFWADLAAQVILFRTRQGLSQTELAKKIGTSYSAISRLESGQHAASGETLRRVADALGLRLVLIDDEASTESGGTRIRELARA
jgi:transcriptional regulator with XRE-family HTH domain